MSTAPTVKTITRMELAGTTLKIAGDFYNRLSDIAAIRATPYSHVVCSTEEELRTLFDTVATLADEIAGHRPRNVVHSFEDVELIDLPRVLQYFVSASTCESGPVPWAVLPCTSTTRELFAFVEAEHNFSPAVRETPMCWIWIGQRVIFLPVDTVGGPRSMAILKCMANACIKCNNPAKVNGPHSGVHYCSRSCMDRAWTTTA
jgi:hypothetical protein